MRRSAVTDDVPSRHDIIVIGASAGGVEALSQLLHDLPADLPATVLVVLHRGPNFESSLAAVLGRKSSIPVRIAVDGEMLQNGVCYIGHPAKHLTVGPGVRARLLEDGFYRGHTIDILFKSAARQGRSRVIGVVLSGLRKDGAEGLIAIKEAGGNALVQLPSEALHGEMPESAIKYDGAIDFIGSIKQLSTEICRLVGMAHAEG